MSAMLEAHNLVKRFGAIEAVRDVSFSLKRGEVLGFLGPNGAGKTTTMKMLTGYVAPTAGRAVVLGHDVAEEPIAAKAAIGYLPEGAPAYGDMTPEEFLGFVAAARGMGPEAQGRIGAARAAVHLESVWQRPIETLSKGFQRRVGLAQAILHDPEVLILDEPTDGLDPNQKFEMRGLIRGMAQKKAIIISTHMLEEVDAVCSRAIIIDRGRLVADSTPGDLKAKSKYHNAVTVVLKAKSPDAALNALEAEDWVGATEARSEKERHWITALPKDGAPILDAMRDLASKKKWKTEEFSVQEGQLDDVFRALTHTETGANAGEAA